MHISWQKKNQFKGTTVFTYKMNDKSINQLVMFEK